MVFCSETLYSRCLSHFVIATVFGFKKEITDEVGEVRTQSSSMQTNPTFGRVDLGAVISRACDLLTWGKKFTIPSMGESLFIVGLIEEPFCGDDSIATNIFGDINPTCFERFQEIVQPGSQLQLAFSCLCSG